MDSLILNDMVSRTEALKIIEDYINKVNEIRKDNPIVLFEESFEEFDKGFAFRVVLQKYIEEPSTKNILLGNPMKIIDKQTGVIHHMVVMRPNKEQIEIYMAFHDNPEAMRYNLHLGRGAPLTWPPPHTQNP